MFTLEFTSEVNSILENHFPLILFLLFSFLLLIAEQAFKNVLSQKIKEKLIAAHKAGMTKVLIPVKNLERDIEDIPKEVRDSLDIVGVSRVEEVLKEVLL